MAELLAGISGRVETGETLTAVISPAGTSVQWQAFVNGAWVNVGAAGSLTYTIPANAEGTTYRLVASAGSLQATSLATAPAVQDTNKKVAPTLTGTLPGVTAQEGALLQGAFSTLAFADGDKANYGGGSLLVSSTHPAGDLLSIRFAGTAAGQFSYNAATREVSYAATSGSALVIGQIDAVQNGNGSNLKVVFNANATKAAVDALIDNIEFRCIDDSPSPQRILTLRVTDPTAGTAQRALLVTVQGTADAPLFTSGPSYAVDENQTFIGLVAAVDPDREPGGDQGIAYALVPGAGAADNAYLSIDARTGELRFLQAPDFEAAQHGPSYSARVRATDASGAWVEQVVTLTVRNVNEAPTAADSSLAMGEDDGPVSIPAIYADPDVGDSHTVTVNTTGTLGSVQFANGQFLYNTGGAFNGLAANQGATDAFTYTVTDAGGLSVTRTVNVAIRGANDTAQILDSIVPSVTEDLQVQNGFLLASGRELIVDPDQGEARFIAQSNALGSTGLGVFNLSEDGTWTYSIRNSDVQSLGAFGSVLDSITIRSVDGTASALLAVQVLGSNDAPQPGAAGAGEVVEAAAGGAGASDPGRPTASGQLLATDADSGDVLRWSGGATGTFGSLAVEADGHWTYTLNNAAAATEGLNAGQAAVETFTVQVRDARGATATQQVSVTVRGVNDAPVIAASSSVSGWVQEPGARSGLLALDDEGGWGVYQTVLQPDGRVVAIAISTTPGASQFGLLRFDPDGQLDTSYGTAGVVSLGNWLTSDWAMDAQGRLILAGGAEPRPNEMETAFERHHPDGSLDLSFGGTGRVTLPVPTTGAGTDAVWVTGDGQVGALGRAFLGDQFQAYLVRLNTDGSIDPGYGQDGFVMLGASNLVSDASVDAAGRVLVAGVNQEGLLQVQRYAADGHLESGYGGAVLDIGVGWTVKSKVAADGSLLLAWSTGSATRLVRIDANGTLDASFGIGGVAEIASSMYLVELQADSQGRALLLLESPLASEPGALACFDTTGVLDAGFGAGGMVWLGYPGWDYAGALTVSPAGSIAVQGSTRTGVSVASFQTNGQLDPGFGSEAAAVTVAQGELFLSNWQADIGDLLQWSGSTDGIYGSFSVSEQGSWTYTLDAQRAATQQLGSGEIATERFTATLTDSHGAYDQCEVVITIVGSPAPESVI